MLAVIAPTIGTASETFITRHMKDLLPGQTAVAADVENGDVLDPAAPRLLLGRRARPHRWTLRRSRAKARLDAARERRLASFFRDQRIDVVMGEYLTWSHQWVALACRAGTRFFAHAHGYDVSSKLRSAEWRSRYLDYRLVDGIITVSDASRQRLLELGLRSDRIHMVPCGVDVPHEPVTRPARDVVRCLAVGRMVAKKAPCLTLEAFRLAAERHPKLVLDFIGAGPLLAAAERYVRDFDLGDRVRLLGVQPSQAVLQAMRDADVFVQHSRTDPDTGDGEGLPVAILEAMAQALPVVSTRHAGIPEAVVEGSTGLLVEEGDAGAMADCLLTLSKDADLRARLGLAGWRRARERYSWEQERASLLDILGLGVAHPAEMPDAVHVNVAADHPLVSVVIPAFNRAQTIRRCLDSVRAQTYPTWEALVVDDGSIDATADLTRAIARQDSRIRLVRHATRRGAQAARNSGIRAARGEWVAFLDSDDEFLPDSIHVRLSRARREGRAVVHSACLVRNADGVLAPYHVPRLAGLVHADLLKREGPVFPGLLVQRSALAGIGWLDEGIIAFQEWDTAIRLADRHEFAFEPEPTFIYNRDHADAMSKDLRRNGRAYEQVVGKHWVAMLRQGGPRAMAHHYHRAERWYRLAGAMDQAGRCRLIARLWSCIDPGAVWGKMRAALFRPA
jgi:colanic acid/amylovoran biosynthesis glycosyltransferase